MATTNSVALSVISILFIKSRIIMFHKKVQIKLLLFNYSFNHSLFTFLAFLDANQIINFNLAKTTKNNGDKKTNNNYNNNN